MTEKMRLLLLEVIMSVVYVFDVSAYPLVHIPLYLLTLLYLASILELVGLFRLARYLSRRFPWLQRVTERTRFLQDWAVHLALFS